MKLESEINLAFDLFPWQPSSLLCFLTHSTLGEQGAHLLVTMISFSALPAGHYTTARALVAPPHLLAALA